MPERATATMTDTAKRRIFAMLDRDGDGTISRTEYLARVDRAAAAVGRPADDPVVDAARTAHEAVFTDMDADHDGDGRLTREEFTRLRMASSNAEADAGQAFDDLDTDGDGLVDRDDHLAGIHDCVTTGASPMAAAYRTLPSP